MMEELVIRTTCKEETQAFGEKIGRIAKAGMIILMNGDLGAGKTTLTQGIAKGLGIQRNVTSPTFTIQKLYTEGRLVLNHIDAYRLEGIEQDLGFEEYMNDDGLTVIEWSCFAPYLISKEYLSIDISLLEDDGRQLKCKAVGKPYEDLLEELR